MKPLILLLAVLAVAPTAQAQTIKRISEKNSQKQWLTATGWKDGELQISVERSSDLGKRSKTTWIYRGTFRVIDGTFALDPFGDDEAKLTNPETDVKPPPKKDDKINLIYRNQRGEAVKEERRIYETR
jgi:hypothetical protein